MKIMHYARYGRIEQGQKSKEEIRKYISEEEQKEISNMIIKTMKKRGYLK